MPPYSPTAPALLVSLILAHVANRLSWGFRFISLITGGASLAIFALTLVVFFSAYGRPEEARRSASSSA